MNVTNANLFGYLGAEQTNLLVSLMKCQRDINGMLPKIDGAYQAPLEHISVDIKEGHKQTVLSLYLWIHGQMYFSIACLLRARLSDSLASTRKAIDAALTAYRLIEEPDTLPLYEEGDFSYQFIKRHIEKARKKDETLFPLAAPLIQFHAVCSEFGSHADIATFIHRIGVVQMEDPTRAIFTVGMFQPPASDEETRRYMVETFLAFCGMLKIFARFIGGLATDFDSATWEGLIDRLGNACFKEAEQLEVALAADQKAPAS